MFNQRGTQVAVATPDGTLAWRSIHIRRDLGASIEVDEGLEGHERVVISPPPDIRDGQKIELQPEKDDGKPMQAAQR